jgi:hypothetical protein
MLMRGMILRREGKISLHGQLKQYLAFQPRADGYFVNAYRNHVSGGTSRQQCLAP